MIRLSREPMEAAFVKNLETVFVHPEIISAGVRNRHQRIHQSE